jgi:hypothetical protein
VCNADDCLNHHASLDQYVDQDTKSRGEVGEKRETNQPTIKVNGKAKQ